MKAQRFCVFNQSQESFLTLGVSLVDTTVEALKKLIEDEDLALPADTGLWLRPYRGISAEPGTSPFDLVCLDQGYRVVQEFESFPNGDFDPMQDEAASVLVLPRYTIFLSQTQPGDQFVICVPEEMEHQLGLISNQSGPDLIAQNTKFRVEKSEENGASVPSLPDGPPAKPERAIPQLHDNEEAEFQVCEKEPLQTRILRWLLSDRRKTSRHPMPGLVAYHWTGGTPHAHQIGDISATGLYLRTEERWYPGTMIRMTLQRTDTDGENPGDSIDVQTKVVRWDSDGEGFAFDLSEPAEQQSSEYGMGTPARKKSLKQFLQRLGL
jgi:hypothetical protein